MKKILLWLAAILITLSAVYFQRVTGPTKPVHVEFNFKGVNSKAVLLRSTETTLTHDEALEDYATLGKTSPLKFMATNLPDGVNAVMVYSLYPGDWSLDTLGSVRVGDMFTFEVPSLPAASKIKYSVYLVDSEENFLVGNGNTVLRFKAPVPALVLVPHIILMFVAMLFSNFTGVAAYLKNFKIERYAIAVLILLGIGGLILGPVVQKYAFDAYWTGWPFGEDLTDNKTLFAFIIWLSAFLLNRKKGNRKYLYIIAALVMLLVYSIPHSTAGSEYDHSKGEVVTGRR
jgi:hypothetical protein